MTKCFLFIFICFGVFSQADSAVEICVQALQFESKSNFLIRKKVVDASEAYRREFPGRGASTLQGPFVPEIIQIRGRKATHAFYIASGADIYRPLFLYPSADNIHLLDIWTGWGKSIIETVYTVKHRLEKLGFYVAVEKLGFVGKLPSWNPKAFFYTSGIEFFHNNYEPILSADDPTILKVRMEVEGITGTVEKRFWLHRFDRDSSADFDQLLASIPENETLVGVLQAGLTGTASAEDLNKILNRLADGAWYANEYGGLSYPPALDDPETGRVVAYETFSEFLNTPNIEVVSTPPYPIEAVSGITPKASVVLIKQKR